MQEINGEKNEPESGRQVSGHRTCVLLRQRYKLGMSAVDNSSPFRIPSRPCKCGLEALRHSWPLIILSKLRPKGQKETQTRILFINGTLPRNGGINEGARYLLVDEQR
jgi:hypothetical protein